MCKGADPCSTYSIKKDIEVLSYLGWAFQKLHNLKSEDIVVVLTNIWYAFNPSPKSIAKTLWALKAQSHVYI